MSDELDTSGFVTTDVADITAASNATAVPAQEAAENADQADASEDTPEIEQDDAGEQPTEEDKAAKRRQTFQERMNEKTRLQKEAEREARYWRDVAEGKISRDGTPIPSNDVGEQDGAPNPDDFEYGETDPKYLQALVDHRVSKGIDAVTKNLAQQQADQAQARAWEAAQEAARAEFDDFDTVMTAKDEDGAVAWDCSPIMAQTIKSMPEGAKLAYQLASDPAESKRIAALPEPLQLIEAGRLMARIDATKTAPAKQTKTATDAPEPPEALARGAGGRFTVAADTDDFEAFERQHASRWFAA
ncbi:hypothetical protein [Rhizorhabdus wittichii]|uniref:hypothetical protein n=1 Tax=Rhizorhabdus wittichii TaxID=160791 RepID=UPI00036B5CA2|nr:hypothetical protein [Rhizorhabdus wittichii]